MGKNAQHRITRKYHVKGIYGISGGVCLHVRVPYSLSKNMAKGSI